MKLSKKNRNLLLLVLGVGVVLFLLRGRKAQLKNATQLTSEGGMNGGGGYSPGAPATAMGGPAPILLPTTSPLAKPQVTDTQAGIGRERSVEDRSMNPTSNTSYTVPMARMTTQSGSRSLREAFVR